MNELSELSKDAREILREHIHFQKEREYAHGILTGFAIGTFICIGVFIN